MIENSILITAPSLDTRKNVSGISSVVKFIITNNPEKVYQHFELGRKDDEKRNLWWLLKILKTTFQWMLVVSSKKIELVHFNFALCKASILRDAPLVLFAKLIQKKIIIHLHGGEYLMQEKPPVWMRFILKRVFAGNIRIIVLSPIEEKAVLENYKVANVKVLPNCVDLKEASAFTRAYNATNPIKLLFMGRIRVDKGIEYIYQSLRILKNKEVPFKFYLAGAGPDEKEYIEKFSVLLGSAFEFKGVVSGLAKTEVLKSCDVFLLPSFFPEGLPMALLESMSFGLVPVVTNAGSMKYVVTSGKNGVIVSDNPIAEIALAIENFTSDTALLQQLSLSAGKFIFENYNPENYIAALNTIYEVA